MNHFCYSCVFCYCEYYYYYADSVLLLCIFIKKRKKIYDATLCLALL